MTRRFGGDRSEFSAIAIGPMDENSIPLLSTSNIFGASPMGNALLQQVRFGLPNSSFNLLPADPSQPIVELENPLPYWQVQTTDNITATPLYDTTAQTWGIYINPGTAPSGDYITLKTRSWVSTDDNFALRQKASLILSKVGSYAGTTQWNTTLTADYYDATNTAVATKTIGTVYDNTTWTSISGTATGAGSAVPSSAQWAEFTIKLTATANITSSTGVTLKSLILASSSPLTSALVVTDTYTASGTWTRPTGVTTLLGVVAIGGGGGGAGGQIRAEKTTSGSGSANGGASGGSSSWALIQNLYVGDQTSVSVGVGTAGAAGTAVAFTKAPAGTAIVQTAGGSGGAGGATTFGTYLTVPGGGGGTCSNQTSAGAYAGGTAAGASTTTILGITTLAAVAGTGANTGGASASSTASVYAQLPYWSLAFGTGAAGGAGTSSGGAGGANGTGGAAGSAGINGSGGSGGRSTAEGGVPVASNGGSGGSGGTGGGGGGVARYANATATLTGTAGNGGASAANGGAGGAAGGALFFEATSAAIYNASTITASSGAGAAGGAGAVLVVYVG